MPNYEKYGKIEQPMSPQKWKDRMDKGHFIQRKHKGFCAVLYYFGVRITEALRAKEERFKADSEALYFDVGKRLKHGRRTPTLSISLSRPYVDEIEWAMENTDLEQRVFPWCRSTGYNIIARVFQGYPHFFRLNRITQLFNDGWTIPEVRAWTGLSLNALNYYVGLASIREKGRTIR